MENGVGNGRREEEPTKWRMGIGGGLMKLKRLRPWSRHGDTAGTASRLRH